MGYKSDYVSLTDGGKQLLSWYLAFLFLAGTNPAPTTFISSPVTFWRATIRKPLQVTAFSTPVVKITGH